VEPSYIGKWVMVAGLALALVGGVLWLLGKAGLPLGRLPGDIRIERGHVSLHFPIVTCILISVILSIVVTLVLRLFRK